MHPSATTAKGTPTTGNDRTVEQAPPVETQRLTVEGVERRVLVAGQGEPLVLLHGIGGSADEWLAVLPHLAAHYRVVAPDAPGHGHSAKPLGHPYDVPYYTQATLALLDALQIGRAPVVAISGGGVVALSLALDHPQRVAKLVLVDAAGLGRDVSWTYRLATLPLARHALRRTNRRRLEAFGRALCYDPARLPDGWVDRRVEIWSTPGAVEAFVSTARAGLALWGQRLDFSRRLGEIRQSTLIVWGRQDPIIPVAHALAAHRAIPAAKLLVFDQCGHMPVWEYPEQFARAVLEFLAS